MREVLTQNLEPLIWTWCAISIAASVVLSITILRMPFGTGYELMTGLAVGIDGIGFTLVLTGIFFHIIDTRTFSKHGAVALHRMQKGGR